MHAYATSCSHSNNIGIAIKLVLPLLFLLLLYYLIKLTISSNNRLLLFILRVLGIATGLLMSQFTFIASEFFITCWISF